MAKVETISNIFTATIKNLKQLIENKVNKTTTINGYPLSDNVLLHASDIDGLQQIDNTSDLNKPVSYQQQEALNFKADNTVSINGHMLNENLIVLTSDEIVGIENVDNTSDINKPVSNAQQSALNLKVDKTTTINGHALSLDVNLDKIDIGLSNCDNTSDLDKPISSSAQLAFDSINILIQTLNNITSSMSTQISSAIPIGSVVAWFAVSAPFNYLICDGSILLQSQYPELFGVLGILYCDNTVNTATHFQLPDLRGEFLRGLDRGRNIDMNRTLGRIGQSASTALPVSLPFQTDLQGSHVHTVDSQGAHIHTTDVQGQHTHDYYRAWLGTNPGMWHPDVNDRIATGWDNRTYTNGSSTFASAGAHSHTTTSAGVHSHNLSISGTHAHTIISGGDNETRPINHACNYIIKAK